MYILILCNLLLLFTFCKFCLFVKETAGIATGMAEKSSWDQANIRQKLGLIWRNRKKISQIIKEYFYLPFFLLIILWRSPFVLERTRIMALCVRHQSWNFKKRSVGERHRVRIGLSYRPARLHRLAQFIPWNRFLGSIKFKNTGSDGS